MESIIYDYYGYNFTNNNLGYYEYQGYKFLFLAINESEQSIKNMENIINQVSYVFDNNNVFIVKNKYNQYISTTLDNKNLCLLTYKDDKISVNEIVKMHSSFINTFNYIIDLDDIILLWDQRLEYIQNQCLVNLNFDNDSHLLLYNYCIHAVGLCLNSLQYLKDIKIDYNKKYNSTLTHRRINEFNRYELFNPFNFIVDHSSRDLSELYKNDHIGINDLLQLTYMYNYQIDEYQYLLARLMFPTCIFDLLEDLATENIQSDYSKEIYKVINKYKIHLNKIKEYYNTIINMMNIRPIDWINF